MVAVQDKLAAVQALVDRRQWDKAYDLGLDVVDSCRDADEGCFADALRHVAHAQLMKGCYSEAEKYLRTELAACKELGEDSWGTASVMLALGELLVSATEITSAREAIKLAEEAQARFREMNMRRQEAFGLLVSAAAHAERSIKDYNNHFKKHDETAEDAATQAIHAFQQIGDRRGEAEAHHSKAAVLALRKDLDGAMEEANAALVIFHSLELKNAEANEWHSLALWAHLKKGQDEESLQMAAKGLALYKEVGSSEGAAGVAALIWQIHMEGMHSVPALEFLRDTAESFKEDGELKVVGECLAMAMHTKRAMGDHDEALQFAQQAMDTFESAGDKEGAKKISIVKAEILTDMGKYNAALTQVPWECNDLTSREAKVDLCYARSESFIQLGEFDKAMEVVASCRKHFQKLRDYTGEASTWMAKAGVEAAMGSEEDLIEGVMSAMRAKELFMLAENKEGEAASMRLHADVLFLRKEYGLAFRAAVRARTMYKKVYDERSQVECTFIICITLMRELEIEMSKKQRRLNYTVEEVPDLIIEQCLISIEGAKRYGWSGMVAASSTILAQAYSFLTRHEESLEAVAEAHAIYKEMGSVTGQASASLVEGSTYYLMGEKEKAKVCGDKAFIIFKKAGNDKGANEALKFLDRCRPKPAEVINKAHGAEQPQTKKQAGAAKTTEQSVPTRAQGEVLKLNAGVSSDIVRNKIMDVVQGIAGVQGDEVDADTPLFAAGLTSQSAMLLRDGLTREMEGVRIPTTLVFDYPSISAICEFLMDSVK